jgi:hypothetical protein
MVYGLQFTVYGLQFTSSFLVLYKTVFSLYVFVTFFAGEGKKSPANFVLDTRQKRNFDFIVIPGLKPRAMDIFLLWRNGGFVVF